MILHLANMFRQVHYFKPFPPTFDQSLFIVIVVLFYFFQNLNLLNILFIHYTYFNVTKKI